MESVPKYKVGSNVMYREGENLREGRIDMSWPVNYHIMYRISGVKNAVHENDIVCHAKQILHTE